MQCLTSTYFSFQGAFYQQSSGTPMGSPLSPVVADIFMEAFETVALDSSSYKPKVWFRYVDDTFIVWPHGRETLDVFLEHLNNQHCDIKFTMEIENNGSLPFLDVLVKRLPDGRLGHSVYRKPTHTDRYLHANSHHHPAQKLSVVNSLVHRAISISQTDNLQSELDHVQKSLQNNGYRKTDIQSTIKRRLNPKSRIKNDEVTKTVAFLPYISRVTDRIGKVLRKHKVKTVFKSTCKMSQLLPNPKDKLNPLSSKGVYSIPCSCGAVYIGETGRSIKTRLCEHQRYLRTGLLAKSAIAEHQHETGHQILFDSTSVVAQSSNYVPRKIREAIEIIKHPFNINREAGYPLPPVWNTVIKPSIGPPALSSSIAPPTSQRRIV